MNCFLATVAFATAVLAVPWKYQDRPQASDNQFLCPDGWTRFEESCYYTEREHKLSFHLAKKRCRDLHSTLFVPNSYDEYKTVITAAPLNYFTWIGLHKEKESTEPAFANNNAMAFEKLDWLNTPYGNAVNGWTTVSQCAAHWNPSTSIGKYTFWYPCNYDFHYICERNQTLYNTYF